MCVFVNTPVIMCGNQSQNLCCVCICFTINSAIKFTFCFSLFNSLSGARQDRKDYSYSQSFKVRIIQNLQITLILDRSIFTFSLLFYLFFITFLLYLCLAVPLFFPQVCSFFFNSLFFFLGFVSVS